MKIENIARAKELLAQRDRISATIAKLEEYDLYLCDGDGLTFETPDDYIVDRIIEVYTEALNTLDLELKEL